MKELRRSDQDVDQGGQRNGRDQALLLKPLNEFS